MRRSIHFKASGHYTLARIFEIVQRNWPEALFEDMQRPRLYIDGNFRPDCTHFRIYETAGSILDQHDEGGLGNCVLEFTLVDDQAKVSAWPYQDDDVNEIVAGLIGNLGWEPFTT